MDLRAFETWLGKLAEPDLKYLERQPGWKREHEKAIASGILPKGFVERTMTLLEGGSESET
jgi:hypothetical protein